uniref:CD320 molecule n=1 Tax=Molossus molossus TaxID=27622 RepID=A0A7J8I558_MOLMO|nr:CD320 molecule [Molossus molossus]
MAPGGADQTAALGLALWLLFGFGLGLEAAPTRSPAQTIGTETLQEGTSVGTPVTPVILESVTYLGNATATFVRDQDSVQSGNRNAYGVIAAAVVLSAGLVAVTLLVLSWLCAQGLLYPPELLVAIKESLLMSERKTSLL